MTRNMRTIILRHQNARSMLKSLAAELAVRSYLSCNSVHSTHTSITKPTHTSDNMVSDAERDEVAQEKYGKNFEECTPEERQSVGGTIGGRKRFDDIGAEGMSEMSQQQESVKAKHAEDAPADEEK